jgi:chemotaxis-related protein WspB
MLFLLFQLGDDRYALDASQVAEVLPLIELKGIPQTPAAVAGVFNCRGRPVPVIDLSVLALGRPAQRCLSTRILVVHYAADGALEPHPLGLIAEKATHTLRREASDFTAPGVSDAAAPYLGPVAADAQGLVQWIDIQKLLPQALRQLLFRQVPDSRGPT